MIISRISIGCSGLVEIVGTNSLLSITQSILNTVFLGNVSYAEQDVVHMECSHMVRAWADGELLAPMLSPWDSIEHGYTDIFAHSATLP